MKAQQYEDLSNLRIKFASIDQYGFLVRDASEEYASFFAKAPKGWSVVEADPVTSIRGDAHNAWLLRTDSEQIAAIAHETGIEFLLAIGANVASTAVIAFVAWAWKRWHDSRASQTGGKAEVTLVLEQVQDRFPDGRIRRSRKLEVHGPIDQAVMATAMRQWAEK